MINKLKNHHVGYHQGWSLEGQLGQLGDHLLVALAAGKAGLVGRFEHGDFAALLAVHAL